MKRNRTWISVLLTCGAALIPRHSSSEVVLADECAWFSPVQWLARHQYRDGTWRDSQASLDERARMTGQGLLCLLSAGYSHLSRDSFNGFVLGETVRRAIDPVLSRQEDFPPVKPEGDAWDAHLWGTWALTMVYASAPSDLNRDHVWKAFDIMVTHLAREGTWDGTKPEDPIQKALVVIVLASSRKANLRPPQALRDGVDAALQDLARRGTSGRLDAVAQAAHVAAALAWRTARDDPALEALVRQTAATLADSRGQPHRLLFWGSLAVYLFEGHEGKYWKEWSGELKERLVRSLYHLPGDPTRHGSWDPPELLIHPPRPLSPIPEERKRQLNALVDRLGDEQWEEREAAQRELIASGVDAIHVVQCVAESDDAEVRTRARMILSQVIPPCVEATILNALSLLLYYRYEHAPGQFLREPPDADAE